MGLHRGSRTSWRGRLGALTAVAAMAATIGALGVVGPAGATDAVPPGPTGGSRAADVVRPRWVGTGAVQPGAVRPGAPADAPTLLDVSCPARDACLAGGVWTREPEVVTDPPGDHLPLVQRWDGERWSMVPAFAGPGPRVGGLEYLASGCGAPDSCVVLASAHVDDDAVDRALHWDGTSWSDVDLAGDTAAPGDVVDCVGPSCVVAIGDREGFVEVTRTAVPWSLPGVQVDPVDLSCTSPRSCVVLTAMVGLGGGLEVGYLDDGAYTRAEDLPVAFEGTAVSCAGHRRCLAVGATEGAPAVWRSAGGAWSELEPPGLDGDGTLADVSCAAVDECVAVGERDGRPVTALWGGGGWQVLDGGLPGAEHVAFTSIDCVPGWCAGVGTAPTEPATTVVAAELVWDPDALPASPTAPTFADVGPDHRFADDVEWLAAHGAAVGYVDGTFRPSAPVTRQAMAAFLHRRLVDGAAAPCTRAPFPDVGVDHRFCDEIRWLAAEGLVQGYPDGTFGPSAPVSRQAVAALLYRSAGSPGHARPCVGTPFPDVGAGHRFCHAVAWAAERGIVEGYPSGGFGPTAPVSRQAAAAFLHRHAAWPAVPADGPPRWHPSPTGAYGR